MSGRNGSISILIVDDCVIVREGLRAILGRQADMAAVGEAVNSRQALGQSHRLKPDVALIKFISPQSDGLEAIEAVRKGSPQSRIIVLSGVHAGEDVRRALRAGVHSFLPWNVQARHLLDAIRSVHQGRRYIHASVAGRLADTMASPALSTRETDVLALIAQGMSNKRIGARLGVTEGTVKSHVNNILGKLSASDRTEAVTRALRLGLLSLD